VTDAPEGSYIYYRALGEQEFLVALNFTDDDVALGLEEERSGQVVLSTELDREEPIQLGRLSLRPHEGIVVASPTRST
jgi:hypothetical protein